MREYCLWMNTQKDNLMSSCLHSLLCLLGEKSDLLGKPIKNFIFEFFKILLWFQRFFFSNYLIKGLKMIRIKKDIKIENDVILEFNKVGRNLYERINFGVCREM